MTTLKIFLDDKSFYCLKQAIPHGSRSKFGGCGNRVVDGMDSPNNEVTNGSQNI